MDGSVDFYADWYTYKYGFGFLSNEFWIGNEKLYFLTNQADYQLRIDLVNSLGSPYYANFDLFRISGEDDLYRLVELGEYSGDAGQSSLHVNFNLKLAFFLERLRRGLIRGQRERVSIW